MEGPLAPEIRDFLQTLKVPGVQLGLERMQALLAALGHPERATPAVHIAGTNGKGSVAAMVEAMARGAGWRTGLYTSPHLVRLGERIQVDRVPISQQELTGAILETRAVVDALVGAGGAEARPTYFEFMTAVAWVHFRRAGCEIAVIEVGMGGRLDATNVIDPAVCAITSIGLDHREFLGGTLAAIAREKAGIIKPGRPVVMGALPPEAAAVAREVAATVAAPVMAVAEWFDLGSGAEPRPADVAGVLDPGSRARGLSFSRGPGPQPQVMPRTRLPGQYQRLNAATATLVGRALGERWRITPEVMANALETVQWPARWESRIVGGRRLVIDVAHNEEGATALDVNLASLRAETGRRPIVVIGVLGKDRAVPLLTVVARHAQAIHLVVPQQRRACSHEELRALVPVDFQGRVHGSTVAALFPAAGVCSISDAGGTPVVVTGSIYLAGEVLWRLEPERGPFEPELQDF